jgi:hypothetical protein
VTSSCTLASETVSTSAVSDIQLYPNPAKDFINFNLHPFLPLQSIQIYNSMGQLMKTIHDSSNTRIDISELSTGIYLINFHYEDRIIAAKFIKK